MTTSSLARRVVAGMLGSPRPRTHPSSPPAIAGYALSQRILAGVLGVDLPRRSTMQQGDGPASVASMAPKNPSQQSASPPGDTGSGQWATEAAQPGQSSTNTSSDPTSTAATVRPMRESELTALHRVDRLVFGRLAYPYFALRQLVELHGPYCVVADDGDEIVGYCFGAPSARRDFGWVLGLAVLPRSRGAGIARSLIREVTLRLFASGMPEVRLAVEPRNDRAIRIYESLGYRMVALRLDYFGPEAHRLIMAVSVGEIQQGDWAESDDTGEWLESDAHDMAVGLGRIHLLL